MNYRVLPIAEEHIPGFRETSDAVFRESQMFTFFEAPPIEQVAEFVRSAIRNNDPQFVALCGDTVVGWCDITIKPRPALRHSGVLGIGVLASCRRQGVGTALLETALSAARDRGLVRVELYVRTDNERAKRLYEKFGFSVEGILRKHILIGGLHRDANIMSLLYG